MNATANQSAIVVGGGIIGIACAHYLSQSGWKVTVIDQGTLAGACSHANCGYICPSHIPPLTEPGATRVALKSLFNPQSPFRVKPTLNPAVLHWFWQFARRCTHQQVLWAGKHLQAILDASIAEYRQILARTPLACEWEEKGLLYVFRTEHAFEEFAQNDQMLTEHFGVAARRIPGSELREFEPGLQDGLYGAFHYPGDASVRPDLLNAEWVRQLRAGGVEFIENCALRGVRVEAGQLVALQTSRGELSAGRYVFAMGAWSAQWSQQLGCRIPIQPGKGYSVTMARPENSPSYPMLFPERKVGVSPFAEGLRLGSMMEFVGYDQSIPETRIQQLRDSARSYLVASVDGAAEEKWYGWRPMTWDSLPIIGPLRHLPNAYLATGHNMLGMSLAPATGRLIAEMLNGEQTCIDATPFSPDRF
ncbi:MAG: FAD-dependent oxidoreductase [Planctomycetes bacterium]|nr:FAD-dependent oxidoreductase [Planctomycetota bacterium]